MKHRINILGKNLNSLKLLTYIGKWHYRYYLLGRHSPLSCGIYITNRCNFSCNFCNIWRNPGINSIEFEKFKTIVDSLSKVGCFYLSLSGGEPFLVKDIFKMIAYAKSRISYLHAVSNGFLIDSACAQALKLTNIDEISISLDGLEETHDRLRNTKGAFKGALSAIENLKTFAPKISIVVNSIICPENLDELLAVFELISRYGLKIKFQPLNVHPQFSGQKSFSQKQIFKSQDLEKLDRLTGFLKKQNNVLNSRYFLSLIPKFFRGETNQGLFSEKCILGYHHCEFNEKGELYPCLTAMGWEGGFKSDAKIRDVLYSKPYREKISQLKSCRLCKENMYICYFEPRITFPFVNFIKYSLLKH